MKQGTKTSEFYITIAVTIIGLLAMFGVVKPDSQQQLVDSTTQIVNAVVAVAPVVVYIIGRSWMKSKTPQSNA